MATRRGVEPSTGRILVEIGSAYFRPTEANIMCSDASRKPGRERCPGLADARKVKLGYARKVKCQHKSLRGTTRRSTGGG